MKAVGLPKSHSFEIGPYFVILCCSHLSAVLERKARRRSMLWPTMGIPSEPGGCLFDDLLPLVKRRKIGMSNSKIVNSASMILDRLTKREANGGLFKVNSQIRSFIEVIWTSFCLDLGRYIVFCGGEDSESVLNIILCHGKQWTSYSVVLHF